ncbi:MAG: hypothetical protein WED04_12360 [Promethearchaeati archaeon SRVP18_Atabeyarchaeia-1]
MSLASLSEAIRKELTTLGIPTVLEMAVVSTSGRVLYTDLSKTAMAKISPFYDSLLMMGQGDNLSLALDASKTIIASRVSNKAILIVITDKKIGIVLTKMSSLRDKFGKLLDELILLEEAKPGGEQASKEAVVETESSPPLPAENTIEEPETPAPPPQPTASVVNAPQVAPVAASVPAKGKLTERVMVPVLTDFKILERCPEKDRKFLELFDGKLSLNDIAKRLRVPFFDALQIANKYKNQGKVDLKEIIRG